MRILVCHPQPPFMSGGAETHANGLSPRLARADTRGRDRHDPVPVGTTFGAGAPDGALAERLDLREANGMSIDLVVAMKFPAYLVNHPRKIIWLIHQQRTAYELWGHPGFGDLSKAPDGSAIRDLVVASDSPRVREAERIFTNSGEREGAARAIPRVRGEVLYHRSDLTERLLGRVPATVQAITSCSSADSTP